MKKEIKVGDIITFKAACRFATRPITRVVLEVVGNHYGVNAYDWNPFWVEKGEIMKVERRRRGSNRS
jgi:hypothetical protein